MIPTNSVRYPDRKTPDRLDIAAPREYASDVNLFLSGGMKMKRIRQKHYEMDMTTGPVLMKMIRFALPLMASSVLQLLYNAADMIVVGQFAGSDALAAVGATGAITSLLVTLFMGFSVGSSVAVAQHYGAERHKDVSESVHTSVMLALVCGVVIGALGAIFSRPLLEMMSTPQNVIDGAAVYMRIYFIGLPATMLYNFCAAILRAIGDTKRPLYYLSIAGVINVLLNLLFVIVFRMGVAGVALATAIAQVVSMALVMICLMRSSGSIHLDLRKVRFHGDKVKQIIRIGLPAGLQSSMFAIANTLIQSSVNTFGSAIIAGNTTAGNIEAFVSSPQDAFCQAAMSFTSQNYGAKKYQRFGRIVAAASGLVLTVGVSLGVIAASLGEPLAGLYTADPQVIEWAVQRLWITTATAFICNLDNVFGACQRALGSSVFPMLVSIVCICLFRIVWIETIFRANPTMEILYYVYPASWLFSLSVHFISFLVYKRRVVAKLKAAEPAMA